MRRLAQPLAVNALAALALRAIVPFMLAESGERYRYFMMSLFFPEAGCSSFHCYRMLPPLLTRVFSVWPGVEIADGFIATGVLFQALAATMLWYVAIETGYTARIAWWAVAWYWCTWPAVQSFSDPLLITDPVQAFWSLATLYLLLRDRWPLALAMAVVGATVKESVLLVPMIFAAALFLSRDERRRRVGGLAVLVIVPVAVWALLRYWLHAQYGYDIAQGFSHLENGKWVTKNYLLQSYFFEVWFPSLGAWPVNLMVATLYLFGACGAAWLLAPFGLWSGGRLQRALTAASVPCMLFLTFYQVPDRALASFPYAVLLPAAAFTIRIPPALTAILLLLTLAFSIRMNAAVPWLPKSPVLLAAILAVTAVATVLALRLHLRPRDICRRDGGGDKRRGAPEWLSVGALAAAVFAFALPWLRDLRHGPVEWRPLTTDAVAIADDDAGTPAFALSSDGRRLAFVGRGSDGPRLFAQDVPGGGGARPLPNTEGASEPFWSPDGTRIGFFAGGKLKALDVGSSKVTELADAPAPRGGSWSRAGVIVFAPEADSGLYRVSALGGASVALENQSRTPSPDRWPSFLPDGDRFLYVRWNVADAGVYLASLTAPGASRQIFGSPYAASYADGFLLLAHDTFLDLRPFDLRRGQLFGLPLHVGRVAPSAIGRAPVAIAGDTLVFAPGTMRSGEKVASRERWRYSAAGGRLDRVDIAAPEHDWTTERMAAAGLPAQAAPTSSAPDGTTLFQAPNGREGWDIWAVAGAPAARASRVVTGKPRAVQGQFAPDSKLIAYSATTTGRLEIYVEAFPPDGRPIQVTREGGAQPRWSRDGRSLFYVAGNRWVMRVLVDPSSPPTFKAAARPLFEARFPLEDTEKYVLEYDVAPDGRFTVDTTTAPELSAPARLVRNWRSAVNVTAVPEDTRTGLRP